MRHRTSVFPPFESGRFVFDKDGYIKAKERKAKEIRCISCEKPRQRTFKKRDEDDREECVEYIPKRRLHKNWKSLFHFLVARVEPNVQSFPHEVKQKRNECENDERRCHALDYNPASTFATTSES